MPTKLLTIDEAAERLNTPVPTLRLWRHKGGYGPPSAKIGARVMYRESDIERWLAAQFDGAQGA